MIKTIFTGIGLFIRDLFMLLAGLYIMIIGVCVAMMLLSLVLEPVIGFDLLKWLNAAWGN